MPAYLRKTTVLSTLVVLAPAALSAPVAYNYVNGGQNWNANFVAPTNSTAQSGMAGYALCSSSSKQSPINIAEQMAVYDATLLPLSLKYGDTESWTMEVTANYLEAAELETATTGSGLATLDTQTDGVVVDGVFVPLNQFHFHSPSEHTINGKHYPLEMHMVHKLFTSDGTLGGTVTNSAGKMAKAAVIGIMFEYSPTDADGDFLSKFQPVFQNMRQFKQFDSTNIEVEDEDAQFSLMDDVFGVIGTDQYYHYNGSLTTVNCYDSISWFNMANALPISSKQLLWFSSVLAQQQGGNSRGGDNRLIQPINGRQISMSFVDDVPAQVNGALEFDTTLSAAALEAQEDALIAGIAAHLGVPAANIDLDGYTDVSPGSTTGRRRFRSLLQTGSNVAVSYSVSTPTAVSAASLSDQIAASASVTSGSGAAPLARSLPASLGVQGVTASSPTVAATACTSAAAGLRGFAAIAAAMVVGAAAVAF